MNCTLPKKLEPLASYIHLYSKISHNIPNIFNDVTATYHFIMDILSQKTSGRHRYPSDKLIIRFIDGIPTGFYTDKYFIGPNEYIYTGKIDSHPLNLKVLYNAIDYGLSQESVKEFLTSNIRNNTIKFKEVEQNTFIKLEFGSNPDDFNNSTLTVPLFQGLRFSKLICSIYSEFGAEAVLTVQIPISCSPRVCEKLRHRFGAENKNIFLDLEESMVLYQILEFLDISI